MALEGSLKDFGLADILQLIYVQKKTGTLKMKHGSNEAKVLFQNGLIITAESSNSEAMNKVGEVLLRSGKITQEQHKEALVMHKKTNEKTGIILVEMGAVSKEELIKALGLHVKEAVFSLFQWKEGRYSFEASDVSFQADYWPPINTEFLIMEGVRRIDEWPYIEKKIPSLSLVFEKIIENQEKVTVSSTEETSVDELFVETPKKEGIEITPDEMIIFNLVDGHQDVRNLIEITNLGEFETCKGLSNLLTAGLIVPKTPIVAEEIDIKKSESLREKWAGLSGRNIISGILMMACFLFVLASYGKIMKTGGQALHGLGIYHELKRNNQLKQIQNSVLTFYYRNNKLPPSLSVLIKEGYPLDSRIDSVGVEFHYGPSSSQNEFFVKFKE